jgi:hypothetical protein
MIQHFASKVKIGHPATKWPYSQSAERQVVIDTRISPVDADWHYLHLYFQTRVEKDKMYDHFL